MFLRQDVVRLLVRSRKPIFVAEHLCALSPKIAGSSKDNHFRMRGRIAHKRNSVPDFGMFAAAYQAQSNAHGCVV